MIQMCVSFSVSKTDSMFFGLDPENKTQIMCAVNVSRDDGFFLSLLQDGSKVFQKTIDPLHPSMSLSVTLSVILPLEKGKNYECQIHLGSTMIMSQPFEQPLETPGSVFSLRTQTLQLQCVTSTEDCQVDLYPGLSYSIQRFGSVHSNEM
jgi:hypothetical protein